MSDPIIYDREYFVAQGKLGGLAAKERSTPKQRKRIARKAAKARWNAVKTAITIDREG